MSEIGVPICCSVFGLTTAPQVFHLGHDPHWVNWEVCTYYTRLRLVLAIFQQEEGSDSKVSGCLAGVGSFFGSELLSWGKPYLSVTSWAFLWITRSHV